MLFGCSYKQSGFYSKKGIVKCADHVEQKVCWTEHIKTWRWVFSSGNHASVLQIRFDVILIDAFHVPVFLHFWFSYSWFRFHQWLRGNILMARRSKIAIAWSFLIKPLLRFSFLVLFLLCFVTGQATSSALFYCQIGQSSKELPEDKFRFQIKGNEIHFLPLGFFNPGEIFYINENGLFFLARAGRVGATSMGEIEFYPGNSFSGREGLFSYSDSSLTFQADCSRFWKTLHPKKLIFSAEYFFGIVLFCASLNVWATDKKNTDMEEINYF